MDRNDEAFRRRVAESDASSGSEEASDEETAYQVREGVTRALDPEDYSTIRNEQELTQESTHSRAESVGGFNPDAELARPPDLPESVQVTDVAPDGTSIGGALTSPTGEAIGGSSVADEVVGRGAALGGDALGSSRLDPLGMLDSSDVGAPTDREVEQSISARDGSQAAFGASVGGYGFDYNPSGTDGGTTVGVGIGPVEVRGTQADLDAITDYFEKAVDDLKDVVTGGSDDEGERPDPNAGDDVITRESIETAIRTNDPGVYAQTTADGGTDDGTATNLAWAAPGNDPRLTNYGPEGPQTVEGGASWVPPPDLIFDPPPDSAGVVGEATAMADPAAAMGSSVIGSGVPEDFPPPPDPPPGDEPVGPPPDGGGDS